MYIVYYFYSKIFSVVNFLILVKLYILSNYFLMYKNFGNIDNYIK